MNISKDKLIEIGNELAEIYGGSCFNAFWDTKERLYIFECIEGEGFSMTLTQEEIKEYL